MVFIDWGGQSGGMSLPQPVLVRPVRRSMSAGKVLALVFGGLLVLAIGVGAVIESMSPSAPVPAPAPVAQVDVSDLPAFWDQQYSTASWYGLSSVPTWDGSVLTAKTSMYPDSDAVKPATLICGAMGMYWLSKPGRLEDNFHPVRVVDQAGNVLVSRNALGEQCTWRR